MGYFTDPNDPDVKRFEVEDPDLFFHYLGDDEYERDEDWALVLPTASHSWAFILLCVAATLGVCCVLVVGTLEWIGVKP